MQPSKMELSSFEGDVYARVFHQGDMSYDS